VPTLAMTAWRSASDFHCRGQDSHRLAGVWLAYGRGTAPVWHASGKCMANKSRDEINGPAAPIIVLQNAKTILSCFF